MKYRVIITIILFVFSFLYLKNAIYMVQDNDTLMKILKEKENFYDKDPIDAIITKHIMIPSKNGKKINLNKSYKKMKAINTFQESLIVYDEVFPNKTINNIYDKVIISGNLNINKVSIITELNNDYCYTLNLTINNACILNKKHTILIHKITNNALSTIKDLMRNGIIIYLDTTNTKDDLNLITKYLKNNNYEIVTVQELINS